MKPVINPESIEAWKIQEGVMARVVAEGKNMTTLMSVWEPQTQLSVHTHPHEQIGICIEGEAIFTVGGKDYLVKKGDVYHIPPNVPHGERNESGAKTMFFECFAPVRDDLLRKRFDWGKKGTRE
jgi:quercetin dioxygenase-like cupin family protein